MLGATLGIRALAFSLVIYIVVLQFQQLRNFTRWQQTILVACFVCIYHLVIYWIEYVVVGAVPFSSDMFFPAISSIAIWWWVFWVLRNIRRRYKVR
jgi:rod shape-determining protein MreD